MKNIEIAIILIVIIVGAIGLIFAVQGINNQADMVRDSINMGYSGNTISNYLN